MLGVRHRTSQALVALVTITLMLATGPGIGGPGYAYGAPAEQHVVTEIVQPTPAVRSGESVRVTVTVALSSPAEYLEVRLRLRTPEGRLIYQKTEVRSEVAEGRHSIAFERPADSPALAQGRYPVEVRVLATGSDPTNASGRVLVLDQDTDPQKVAIVARMWATPTVTRDGRFGTDPATQTQVRDDLTFVTNLATTRRAPISIIMPPVLLEELGRVAEGYQTVDGTEPVPAGSDASVRAADVLGLLASAREGGLVTLVDTPYALPDLAGLASIGATSDLGAHWSRADSVLTATLRSTTTSTTAYLGLAPADDSISALEERQSTRLIVPERSLVTTAGEPAGGVRPLGDTGLTAIVPDEDASAAVDLGSTEFYDVLFDRLGTGPVTLMMDAGPDADQRASSIQRAIEMIGLADWLELAPLDSLEPPADTRPAELLARVESTAPAAHWEAVAAAREALLAYRESVGPEDADAEAAARAVLVTESGLWAGPSGSWARSGRAREMAEDVSGFVAGEFEKITFDAKDVTLSGTTGEIPFTLVNNTGKHLTLTIVATFEGDQSRQVTQVVEVDPMQNFITVPVDLRNSMKSRLTVVAMSGTSTVAETTLTLHTSYIDRLAVVAMVILVLLLLLVMIRRRMVSQNAATIDDGAADVRSHSPNDEQ